MRAIFLFGIIAAILGGSLLFARQATHDGSTGSPNQPSAATECSIAIPVARYGGMQRTSIAADDGHWLQLGLLLGRVQEAARRDVAPSVLATLLREGEALLAQDSTTVHRVVHQLANDLGETNSPEAARSLIADTIAGLQQKTRAPAHLSSFAAASIAWDGTWDTTYGRMVLTVGDNGQVTGAYGSSEHQITAQVDPANPNMLEGTWQEGTSRGRFRFQLLDGGRWQGHWTSGDAEPDGFESEGESESNETINWTATRVVDENALARWIGEWDTSYGKMTLAVGEESKTIEGWYGSATNRVVGWVDPSRPDVLVGYWYYKNTTASGRIEFRLTGDQQWNGGWSSGLSEPSPGSWTGTRQLADTGEGDVMEGDVLESFGPGEGAEAGSVPVGEYGVPLGEE